MRRIRPKGLVFTVDLRNLAERELPEGSTMTLDEWRRTIEAPFYSSYQEPVVVEWGDGTSNTYSSADGQYPTHTYAAGMGDIFRVVVRSITGHLPIIRINRVSGGTQASYPEKNLTWAITSVDHFDGMTGPDSVNLTQIAFAYTKNLRYVDPKIAGLWNQSTLAFWFYGTAIEQPVESFCFDYMVMLTDISHLFRQCGKLAGVIPSGMFDNNKAITTVTSAFRGCSFLPPPPTYFGRRSFRVFHRPRIVMPDVREKCGRRSPWNTEGP